MLKLRSTNGLTRFRSLINKPEAFMFETPSDELKNAYKSSLQIPDRFDLSPANGKNEEQKFAILSDFAFPDLEVANKLSSTAAFKTVESSVKKPLISDSPWTDKAIKIHDNIKTAKRVQRQTNEFIKIPNRYDGWLDLDQFPHLSRKKTNQQMVVMNEGHSEPFEIIESIECTNFVDSSKRNNQRRIDFNTDVNAIKKEIQTSSYMSERNNFWDPECFNKSKYIQNQFTESLSKPILSQISQSTFNKISSQLIPKQKPKK